MSGIRLFELLDPLAAGGQARARLLNWNGERYVPSRFVTVTVHDFVGGHGEVGDRGYCSLSEDSHRWEFLCGLSGGPTAEKPMEIYEDGAERPTPPRFAPLSSRLADDSVYSHFAR